MLKISKYARIIYNGCYAVFASQRNGTWIKVPKTVADVIIYEIRCKHSYNEIINSFEEEEDKVYVDNVLDKLSEMGIIIGSRNIEMNKFEDVFSIIYYEITDRCNLQCKHCAGSAVKCSEDEILSYEEVISIVDKIIAAKPYMFTLTGGEPLVRKDFIRILKYIRSKYDGHIKIMTNGLLIDKSINEIYRLADSFDISIDGINEETCSKIRGEGVFSRVIKNIKLLQEKGFENISLSMTRTSYNYEFEEKFNDLCKEINVLPMIRELSEIGRARNNAEELRVKEESKIQKVGNNGGFHKSSYKEYVKAYTCSGMTNSLVIHSDGSISPCSLLRRYDNIDYGNIRTIDSLYRLIKIDGESEIETYFNEKVLPKNFTMCKLCNVNIFCWRRKCQMMRITNENDLLERCKERKEKLQQIVWG